MRIGTDHVKKWSTLQNGGVCEIIDGSPRSLPLPTGPLTKISGKFTLTTHKYDDMVFIWDGAAISSDGKLILIEEELCTPVDLHIQGHVSRVAVMLAHGVNVTKVVWVTRPKDFDSLFRIVESWRNALFGSLRVSTPPCEYLDPSGAILGSSGVVT